MTTRPAQKPQKRPLSKPDVRSWKDVPKALNWCDRQLKGMPLSEAYKLRKDIKQLWSKQELLDQALITDERRSGRQSTINKNTRELVDKVAKYVNP